MKAYQIIEEWNSFTGERKLEALNRIAVGVSNLVGKNGIDDQDAFLFAVINLVSEHDEEDYFGTDGLDV